MEDCMFGLFTRTPRARKRPARHTTTLFLERLEDRLTPSGTTETVTLNVIYRANQQAVFQGTLTDQSQPNPSHTVNLTGAVNTQVTCSQSGGFTITLPVSNLGTVYAASSDGHSNTAQYTLVGGSPVVDNFKAVSQGGGLWLFSGSVTGAPVQGEIVEFGGITPLIGQKTSLNAHGMFAFYAMVPSGEGGWADAVARDWWGDTSKAAIAFVNC
jgi:hypothetical protein